MASRRTHEELVIVAFDDPPEEANCFLVRWAGGDITRPTHLVYDVRRSEFLNLDPEAMALRVTSLDEAGSEIFAGYWTDQWVSTSADSHAEIERVRFSISPGSTELSGRPLLDLREYVPVLANQSLSELRSVIARDNRVIFDVQLSSVEEAAEILGRVQSLGFVASFEVIDTTPAWPPIV